MRLALRAGHGTNMTITVEATAVDKAQILEVSAAQCKGYPVSPRRVCNHVVGRLQAYVSTLQPPVRKAEWLPEVRAKAREARATLIGK